MSETPEAGYPLGPPPIIPSDAMPKTWSSPAPPELTEMLHVFRRDLQRLREMVGGISINPPSVFFTLSSLFFGMFISGIVALLGFTAPKTGPYPWQGIAYWLFTGVGISVSLALGIAGVVFKAVHESDKRRVLNEIDRIEYQSPVVRQEPTASS